MDVKRHSLLKLERMMGPEAARQLVNDIMSELSLPDIDSPTHRFRFGGALVTRGGVYEAIGRAIRVQAALQGAETS